MIPFKVISASIEKKSSERHGDIAVAGGFDQATGKVPVQYE
jgi:hypothetical protein